MDIRERDTPGKVPFHRAATVGHRICFQPSGRGDLIMTGSDRDLTAQKPTGLGAAADPPFFFGFTGLEQPIHLSRADGQNVLADLRGSSTFPCLVGGQPKRQ